MTVVPEPAVVVGLDLTDASARVLAWAAEEAAAHHAPLVAVYVLDPRGTEAVYSPAGERTLLDPDEALARVKELIERTGVGPLRQIFEIGVPGRVLAQLTRGARMLVLGQARHHQRASGTYPPEPAVGAIARACIAHAECPVVIVPEPAGVAAALSTEASERHTALVGGRALYPFQGRIPVAHQ